MACVAEDVQGPLHWHLRQGAKHGPRTRGQDNSTHRDNVVHPQKGIVAPRHDE